MPISKQSLDAIETLKSLDDDAAKAAASVLRNELESFDSKVFTLVGEKRKTSSSNADLREIVDKVSSKIGVKADDLDSMVTKLDELVNSSGTVDGLTKKLTELEVAKTALNSELSTLKLGAKVVGLADSLGVDRVVFGDLFSTEEQIDKFTVPENETVPVYDGKPFQEYVKGDTRLSRYEGALFKTQPKPTAPGTPPGKPEEKVDPVAAYLTNMYSGKK